jgi:hypothetical protein
MYYILMKKCDCPFDKKEERKEPSIEKARPKINKKKQEENMKHNPMYHIFGSSVLSLYNQK